MAEVPRLQKLFSPNWKRKCKDWLKRYGFAEVVSIAGTYLGFIAVIDSFDVSIATASFGGSIGEALGFYSVIGLREFWRDRAKAQRKGKEYGSKGLLKTTMLLASEFGPSEIFDAIVIRPFCIGISAYYLGTLAGILVGKLTSDVAFYIPVILTYELQQAYAKRKERQLEQAE